MLDCETPVGKKFIKHQHDVEFLVGKHYDVTVKTKHSKIEKYDLQVQYILKIDMHLKKL